MLWKKQNSKRGVELMGQGQGQRQVCGVAILNGMDQLTALRRWLLFRDLLEVSEGRAL